LLVNHFLDKYSRKQGKTIQGLSSEAMNALMEYSWPGNVRELENTLERLVVFARDEEITTQDLVYSNTVLSSVLSREPLRLQDMERLHIIKVLQRAEGNKTEAARLLGIDRKTLRTKIKKYEIAADSA
jgi:DNA-binding NtrC family response regulator